MRLFRVVGGYWELWWVIGSCGGLLGIVDGLLEVVVCYWEL